MMVVSSDEVFRVDGVAHSPGPSIDGRTFSSSSQGIFHCEYSTTRVLLIRVFQRMYVFSLTRGADSIHIVVSLGRSNDFIDFCQKCQSTRNIIRIK